MADRTGQHLGHYRFVKLPGSGGTALVSLGRHAHLGREAASKPL